MPGARLVKAFNTLTAGFQASSAGRAGGRRVASSCPATRKGKTHCRRANQRRRVCGDRSWRPRRRVMKAPRRPGLVYVEEYREADARAAADAWRARRSIPPTPHTRTRGRSTLGCGGGRRDHRSTVRPRPTLAREFDSLAGVLDDIHHVATVDIRFYCSSRSMIRVGSHDAH